MCCSGRGGRRYGLCSFGKSYGRARCRLLVTPAALFLMLGCGSQETSPPTLPDAQTCPRLLTRDDATTPLDAAPDWSWARPEWLVYTHDAIDLDDAVENGAQQVWVINVRTNARSYVTAGAFPGWSSDGMQIVYDWFDSTGEIQLWLVDLRTMELRQLTEGSGAKLNADWSPDGRWIAYEGSHGTELDSIGIWLIEPITGHRERLCKNYHFPDWAPNSKCLVMNQVTVVAHSAPDSVLTYVSRDGVGTSAWAPTGDRIAFWDSRAARSGGAIYVLDLETRAEAAFVDWGRWPTWSPDGLRIAYAGVDSSTNTTCLYVKSLDGRECRQLTRPSDYDSTATAGSPAVPAPRRQMRREWAGR